MQDLITVLGILGAYFAILLMLAVAVETILEPIKLFRGLHKKVSPEQAMKDAAEWLPAGTDAKTRATAIANFIEEFNVGKEEIEARVGEISAIANDTAKALGVADTLDDIEKQVAVRMAAIRQKYALDEQKRIAILRVASAVIGILLAIALQVNTFDLLADLFPQDVQALFESPLVFYGGMVLTGLAASAGSSFWHDQLGKVRALKDAARQMEGLQTGERQA